MKLKDYIVQKNVVLGNTEDGKAWALKALHPADPLTEVRGIPDESAVPSVFQNFQQTYTLSNPTASTVGNWEFDLFFLPSPVVMGAIRTRDSSGAYLWSTIVNPQVGIAGDPWYTRQALFSDTVERFRLAYAGITGHLDAAAISNQGSIAVAQYAQMPFLATVDTNASGGSSYNRPIQMWNELPKTWDQLISMPNAYVAAAKDGVYAPYKLGRTCQKWKSSRALYQFLPYGTASGFTTAVTSLAVPVAAPSMTSLNGGFPFGLTGAYVGGTAAQFMVQPRADVNVLHIAGRNLHYQSAVTFIIRHGYETQVSPASQLTPFAKISPRHDELAIDGYFAVAREFKDAYPEEYNSWEEILGVIGNAVGDVISSVVPGGGTIVRAAKAILPKMIPRNPADVTQMSAVQKENAKEAVAAASRSMASTARLRKKIAARKK